MSNSIICSEKEKYQFWGWFRKLCNEIVEKIFLSPVWRRSQITCRENFLTPPGFCDFLPKTQANRKISVIF